MGLSEKPQTVLYLAYGSNLAASTFLGRRQIRPLGARNVVVPSLRLTFDLPGVPYQEPCFANSGRRDPTQDPPSPHPRDPYHKDRWHKGLVGVAYELTPEDYAHVIATEGGGASYQDIEVDCFELPAGSATVPQTPSTPPFKARTLFAPATADRPEDGARFSRPDPSYAQPSQRYLDLILTGAGEHDLPAEYRHYLERIRAYRISSARQRIGQAIFVAVWVPILTLIFIGGAQFADKDGKLPNWLKKLAAWVFATMWGSYDGFFFKAFGDGERSIGDNTDVSTDNLSLGSRRPLPDVVALEAPKAEVDPLQIV